MGAQPRPLVLMLLWKNYSGVRKKILEDNKIQCEAVPSNVDEDQAKASLLAEGANPEVISKNLASLQRWRTFWITNPNVGWIQTFVQP